MSILTTPSNEVHEDCRSNIIFAKNDAKKFISKKKNKNLAPFKFKLLHNRFNYSESPKRHHQNSYNRLKHINRQTILNKLENIEKIEDELNVKLGYLNHLKSIDLSKYSFANE